MVFCLLVKSGSLTREMRRFGIHYHVPITELGEFTYVPLYYYDFVDY